MCGRYVLKILPYELQEFFDLLRMPEWNPRYNIAPTQTVIAVRQHADGRSGDLLRWGLVPRWADSLAVGSRMINARSETIDTSKAFKAAFKAQRCIIPASGFFEWEQLEANRKQPWHIYPTDSPVFSFAGLWETWKSPEGTAVETCTILTCEPNDFMSRTHNRMPVILSRDAINQWLNPAAVATELKTLCIPCPDEWLVRQPVSTLVSNIKNDSPECIKPVKQQPTLFD